MVGDPFGGFFLEVKQNGLAQVDGEFDALVLGFAGQLNTEVPGAVGDEAKGLAFVENFASNVRVHRGNGTLQGSTVGEVFLGDLSQLLAEGSQNSGDGLDIELFLVQDGQGILGDTEPGEFDDLGCGLL